MNTNIQKINDCLGVVLAGGLSSRMGKDKSTLMRKSNNMLTFSTQLLKNSGISNVVVSGKNHQIPDVLENMGPVGGIYSVLAHLSKNNSLNQVKSFLILPIDLPLMTVDALQKLIFTGQLNNKATFYQGHNIPLFLPNNAYLALFMKQVFLSKDNNEHHSLLTKKNNKKNGPSIKSLLNQVPNQSITAPKNNVLFNTNSPEQWQQAIKQFN